MGSAAVGSAFCNRQQPVTTVCAIPKVVYDFSAHRLDGSISKFKALLLSRCEKEAAMHQDRWRTKAGMIAVSAVALGLVAGFVLGMNSTVGASAGARTRAAAGSIPHGYAQVDPRNPARS